MENSLKAISSTVYYSSEPYEESVNGACPIYQFRSEPAGSVPDDKPYQGKNRLRRDFLAVLLRLRRCRDLPLTVRDPFGAFAALRSPGR